MKKFYALALAAFALTASAEGLQGGFNLNPVKTLSTARVNHAPRAHKAPAKAAAAAPTIDEITGVYTWYGYEYLTDQQGNELGESVSGMVVSAVEGNELTVAFDYGTFKATFDPETGNIAIANEQTVDIEFDGETLQAYISNVQWSERDNDYVYVDADIILPYSDGAYEMPIGDIISILCLEKGQPAGYFHFSDENYFEKYTVETPEGWTNIGAHKYQDYYVLGGFNLDPADYIYEVTVAQKADNENVIRILNPYNTPTFPAVSLNENENGGYIEIDYSNPNFITVTSPEGAGFGAKGFATQEGTENLYPSNLETYLKTKYPTASEEAMIEQIEADGEPTTFVDDVLTINDPVFGITGRENDPLAWPEKKGIPAIAILWLGDETTGINNVIADNANNVNAPVVYFNLQGVQVANPQGGIFIRKQGNETTKVIIK